MEEFKSLPSNINTNDDLLKFLFIKEGSDIIKYNKLSEGIKIV